MVRDIELTLNRWGFGKIAENYIKPHYYLYNTVSLAGQANLL